MTLEIFDYLLIRSMLLNVTSDEMIEAVKEKEQYGYMLELITNLMQDEDFHIIYKDVQEKMDEFVFKYRFQYNKDKEINEMINYIINRFNDYKSLSEHRKRNIINSFYFDEYRKRSLPVILCEPENIHDYISNDFKNYMALNYKVYNESDDNFQLGGEIELTDNNIPSWLATINLILNTAPEELNNDAVRVNMGKILETLKNDIHKLNRINRAYLKITLKKIRKMADEDKKYKRLKRV